MTALDCTVIQTWINNCKAADCDFIYLTQPYDAFHSGNAPNQQQFVDAAIGLCRTNDLAWIDNRALTGGYCAVSVAAGNQNANDGVHETAKGKAVMAGKMVDVLAWAA